MLEWNAFGRGFDSRRLHHFLELLEYFDISRFQSGSRGHLWNLFLFNMCLAFSTKEREINKLNKN